MKRIITRSRSLLLVVALAVVAAMCTVSTANAASSASETVVPAAPSNLAAKAVSPTSVKLTWTNHAANQSGVVISRDGVKSVDVQGATVSSYTWKGLSPGTKYWFYVASKIYGTPGDPTGNGNTQSAWVGPVYATTPITSAASSAQCNFVLTLKTCESTDHTVAYYDTPTGDTSHCTFVFHITWGDGHSTTKTLTNPTPGHHLLAQHTYAAPKVYTITVTPQTTVGTCTATSSVHTFTLLKPAPSPRIYWSKTSGRAGTLITLTGKSWIPGGTVQIHQPEKNLFLGITAWTVDSHGNWKHDFAEQDAPPGSYKFSFTETSGHLRVTSSFTVLDPPNLTDRFSNWVDACYHGKLKFDSLCKDALDEAAHLKLSFTSLLSCLTELKHGVKSGIAVCLIEDGIGVVTWVYNTWKSWWTHKPGP